MRAFFVVYVAILLSASAQSVQIPLTGVGASETSGDGFAFVIPNLDGIGGGQFNPLTYPVPPFDPGQATPSKNPSPPGPNEVFSLGTLTYNAASLSGVGVETLPVTGSMFSFDFSNYGQATVNELAIIGTVNASISLSNLSGPGLKFVDGTPVALDFTAAIQWLPTLNGSPQTYQPPSFAPAGYTGSLTVENGTFTFALSDSTRRYYIGAKNVVFTFDLVATVTSLQELPSPTFPTVTVRLNEESEVEVAYEFPEEPVGTFQLEASNTLGNDWEDMGAPFSAGGSTPPVPISFSEEPRRFFRVRLAED
ncbi:MAG: hypothetical protein AAF555_06915 [Verrucomicrobiota bacterium]